MTREVVTFLETDRCADVLARMHKERFRRAPILRDGVVVGMVTQRDLLPVLPRSVGGLLRAEHDGALEMRVVTVMSTEVVSVGPMDHLEDVARILLQRKIGGLPVLDGTRLVGIVTESDVFRVFVDMSSGREDVRVTIGIPEAAPSAHGRPREQPAAVCLRLSLEVLGLLTHESPGGAHLVTVRAAGARAGDLAGQLAGAGYSILEVVHPRAAAAG